MAVRITEYGGYLSGRPFAPGLLQEPALATTVLSSAVTSTMTLQAGTRFVVVDADANAWILFTASSLSTTVATSTNSARFPANVTPQIRGVTPGSRLTCLST